MISERIKHEIAILPYTLRGYSRRTASRWVQRKENDYVWYGEQYDKNVIKRIHKKGYRAKRIGVYTEENYDKLVTDLDYLSLDPINSNYGKWINDYNTFKRVAINSQTMFPEIYFSFFRRGMVYANTWPQATERVTAEHIISFLKKNPGKRYEFRPAFFKSREPRYILTYIRNKGILLNNKQYISREKFRKIVNSKTSNYLLIDHVKYMRSNYSKEYFIKFYISNDKENIKEPIVGALIEEMDYKKDIGNQHLVNLQTGYIQDFDNYIFDWEKVLRKIKILNEQIKQIRFYSLSIVITPEGEVVIKGASDKPFLPRIPYNEELLDCLKVMVEKKKKEKHTIKERYGKIRKRLFAKWVEKHCPSGMRPYMEKMWLYSLKEDFKYKGTTLKEKRWSWEKGFLSYRIEQYGLTENNYKTFLSDYQYHWLNRINNVFQLWINDKTTFRYVLEPFKDSIPKYYFNVFKVGNEKRIEKMIDCPNNIENSVKGILTLLKQEKKLVFKASAGTHGDGFYCFEYKDDSFYANGETIEQADLEDIILQQKSFYLVTSYINMNADLKKIYPTSVNTIRMAVVNRGGYNPEIMQTYIRIGSSKTGYTDNVGYGGICAMIDISSGRLYNAEKLVNHKYLPCPEHPDTGFKIDSMIIPHWENICNGVKEISKLLPELEYLGFDVAVTEDGFEIVEINIHQDLHKVGEHSLKYKEFYRNKLKYKMGVNHIDKDEKKNQRILCD